MDGYESYGKAKFGDKRLNKRLPRIIEQLAGDPAASISAACKDQHQAKAAYRFIGNENVTTDEITRITHAVTIENINTAKPPVVLIPQDTTEVNYSNLKATSGLGNIGSSKTAMGIHVHSAVAIGETGEVYGLMAQKIWVRPPEEFGKSENRKETPIEDKESYKWLETMENAEAQIPESTFVVHICDREGDIFELFCKAQEDGSNYLCRRFQNRKIDSEDADQKLDDFIGGLPAAGRIIVQVPRDSHTNRKARDATVEVKYGKCSVTKPAKLAGNKDLPESIEVYVVSAVEIDPPPGQEKIFWQLVTNVPTESFEDALTRIEWYTQRWKIEIFHRTLKEGCKVEELQSDSADKLMKLLAIYSIIALQIMFIGYMARTRPDESCEICFSEEEWKILYRVAEKTTELPEKPPTVLEAVVMVAKLGGFLARKSDGFPGVKVLWRGLTSFYIILEAAPFLI